MDTTWPVTGTFASGGVRYFKNSSINCWIQLVVLSNAGYKYFFYHVLDSNISSSSSRPSSAPLHTLTKVYDVPFGL